MRSDERSGRDVGASVEFRHVSKRYERGSTMAAVVDLSLMVPPGEVCVLVGPSGCGKTTTLKMVNRLVEPTSGQILIDGEDIATVEPTALRRRIGYVIQQTGLFPHRTVAQNVATVPQLLGWPSERIRSRVDELLTLVGLDPAQVRDRYPSQLSGGERQRVGVARAMAAEPPVMLMDEPFGAVDPIVRERLQDEFLRIHRELRTTVLFVTHDIDEAIKMGDRVAIMQQGGVLAQYARPADVLLHPASEFVARFVGADRGLKRLALSRIEDMELLRAPSLQIDESPDAACRRAQESGSPLVVRVDADSRPISLIRCDDVQSVHSSVLESPHPRLMLLNGEMTLRDALSQLITAGTDFGVVIGPDGAYRGVLTLDALTRISREDQTDSLPAPTDGPQPVTMEERA